ncbi:MAG: phosphotransferase [Rhodococcus sp. (in: high G+C Gram-positive bacteria)]|uniref:phosphotransferase n=1 Tax=Rhodococcus sp. TaxID=1831 RepID=UPI003BAEB48D
MAHPQPRYDTPELRLPRLTEFPPPRGTYPNSETGDFVLVLEDLSPAESGDQIIGCSVSQAKVVMDAAAALHGPSWGNIDLDDAEWNVRPNWIPQIQDTYPALFAEFRKAFADRNTEQEFAIGEKFGQVIGRWFDEQPRPWTITHGDYRLDNILFDIKGGTEPVGILDWQTIMLGPGTADVSYFLGGCLPTELRRENETALLQRYHSSLIEHGVHDYGFDRLVRDYRYNAFMGYFMCSYAAMLVPRTERGDHMFSVWLQRIASQITDHDSMSLLPQL